MSCNASGLAVCSTTTIETQRESSIEYWNRTGYQKAVMGRFKDASDWVECCVPTIVRLLDASADYWNRTALVRRLEQSKRLVAASCVPGDFSPKIPRRMYPFAGIRSNESGADRGWNLGGGLKPSW